MSDLPTASDQPPTSGARRARLLTGFALGLGLLLLILNALDEMRRVDGEYNLYVWQASAWLHGHLDIRTNGADVAYFRGRLHVPFPPFPALVLLPAVALLGMKLSNTIAMGLAATALAMLATIRLCRHLDVPKGQVDWICGALVGGTGVALCLWYGSGVWFFAHLVSFACLAALCAEAVGQKRAALMGLLVGLSFLSRQMTVFALLLPIATLWDSPQRLRQLFALFAGFGICAAVYLWYNAARFGDPLETGYGFIHLNGFLKARFVRFGMFNVVYIPFNLIHLLIGGPTVVFAEPELIKPTGSLAFGTALPIASPFLAAVFWAKAQTPAQRRQLRAIGWACTLMIVPTLLYYNNGYQQYNAQRFTLDFLPLLMVPLALGLRRFPDAWWRGLVLWSVWLNVLLLVVLHRL